MIGLLSPHTRAAVLASAPRRKIQKNRKPSDIRDDDGMYPFACYAFSQHVLSRVITCFHLSTRVDKSPRRTNRREQRKTMAGDLVPVRHMHSLVLRHPSWVGWARKWTAQVLAGRVAAPIVHLHLKDAREGTLPALAV